MQNVLLDQIVQLEKVEDTNEGQTFPQVEEIKAAVLSPNFPKEKRDMVHKLWKMES